jgi:hypothetical protein
MASTEGFVNQTTRFSENGLQLTYKPMLRLDFIVIQAWLVGVKFYPNPTHIGRSDIVFYLSRRELASRTRF